MPKKSASRKGLVLGALLAGQSSIIAACGGGGGSSSAPSWQAGSPALPAAREAAVSATYGPVQILPTSLASLGTGPLTVFYLEQHLGAGWFPGPYNVTANTCTSLINLGPYEYVPVDGYTEVWANRKTRTAKGACTVTYQGGGSKTATVKITVSPEPTPTVFATPKVLPVHANPNPGLVSVSHNVEILALQAEEIGTDSNGNPITVNAPGPFNLKLDTCAPYVKASPDPTVFGGGGWIVTAGTKPITCDIIVTGTNGSSAIGKIVIQK